MEANKPLDGSLALSVSFEGIRSRSAKCGITSFLYRWIAGSNPTLRTRPFLSLNSLFHISLAIEFGNQL
ncbi:MAG: hypothetical protein AB7V56_07190 [Candidatus Nitrosocosmicus sp.]|uniref:hypothetical protein n=1 Tax=Candidatus Nitrosocosmicus agrestis TaxID=2563600 RepID=UPI00122E923F|nr:hypothetical protein [Candidatus Nitrosocosmicus sp. SS]KAA2281167.1 hypothetical protein F1Z66_09605 [Candidatus Nitrosocosmicus sp. SS]KAF0869467.1 hypothetical protein E5N71_05345 [Candidatus Nitrosocosmicus sp. SS]